MKKLYIFDFDGTLVNTFHDSVIAYNKALAKHGKDIYEYEDIEDVDYNDFINNMSHDEEVLRTYGEIYENSPKIHTKAYPGIKKTLQKLEKKGCMLAICSNRMQSQLENYADTIFEDIDFKYVVGYEFGQPPKPDPAMINKILDNESFKKDEIVYVGDSCTDIKTAYNVDIDVIIVKWGQGDDDAFTNRYPIGFIEQSDTLLEF
ncbi:MAG: hypothetical protein BZ133_01715 [Methanosphaera sp. SHI613]|jgi:phosphoglycolate phosphatase|nr:MAG: hypothetical protein BZ133_01715 [Methanosphaera sp. SHI613]